MIEEVKREVKEVKREAKRHLSKIDSKKKLMLKNLNNNGQIIFEK